MTEIFKIYQITADSFSTRISLNNHDLENPSNHCVIISPKTGIKSPAANILYYNRNKITFDNHEEYPCLTMISPRTDHQTATIQHSDLTEEELIRFNNYRQTIQDKINSNHPL